MTPKPKIITSEQDGLSFTVRESDGYINGTAMCKNAGKLMADWIRQESTQAFLLELSTQTGIPATSAQYGNSHIGKNCLVEVHKGGRPELMGTWVHPDVAMSLAMWLSPKWQIACIRVVKAYLKGELQPKSLTKDLIRKLLGQKPAKWEKTFPDEFYEAVLQLHGWQYTGTGSPTNHRWLSQFTNTYVYDGLVKGLTGELKDRAQKLQAEASRKNCWDKLHQFFEAENKELLHSHIWQIKDLAKSSYNMDDFKARFGMLFGDQKHLIGLNKKLKQTEKKKRNNSPTAHTTITGDLFA